MATDTNQRGTESDRVRAALDRMHDAEECLYEFIDSLGLTDDAAKTLSRMIEKYSTLSTIAWMLYESAESGDME